MSPKDIWVVLPLKPFEEGKTRLAAVLTAAQRAALNRRFFLHTLDAAREVFAANRIVVVTRSREAMNIAAACGALALAESGSGGLNEALAQASVYASGGGAEGLLALSCDLPRLCASDIRAMIGDGDAHRIAIAGDLKQSGTNALLVAQRAAIVFRYGDNSFARHIREARLAGIEPHTVRRPGLAFDIDTPEDLKELLAQEPHWID